MDYIYLKPEGLYFSDQPAKVTTVLGSCVAVTMHHQDSGMAAICHAVQPTCQVASICKDRCPDKALRYVDCVIPRMVECFRLHGVRPESIQVKLFGGGAIIGSRKNTGSQLSVGQMNVAVALQTINSLNLSLTLAKVGGHVGCKIIFNTRTGDVWMKRLQNGIIALDAHLKDRSQSVPEPGHPGLLVGGLN